MMSTTNISWPYAYPDSGSPLLSSANNSSIRNPLFSVPPIHYVEVSRSSSSYGDSYPYPYPYGDRDDYNVSWNNVLRLLFLSLVSTAGTMGGIFVISAITVIDTFQVRGNCFLVSLAFGHLLVTILVLPASAVAIMAGVADNSNICRFQWFITLSCLIISVLSFMFMSIDNFFGFGSLVTYDLCCTKCRIVTTILFIWAIAVAFPVFQYINNFGPEFCKDKRSLKIWIDFHPVILGILIIFTLITIWYFTRSLFQYKNYKMHVETAGNLDPTAAFVLTDGYLLQSNVMVYLTSLAMWMPMVVAMIIDPINPVPQHYLDTMWYIALANSCLYSYLYAATNRDFREAFNKLFYYCCCKSHVTFTRKGAAMRRSLAADSMGLRVHIIPGLNIYAQRKDATYNTSYRTGSSGMGSTGSSGGGSYHHSGGGFLSGGAFAKTFQSKSCEL